MSPLPPTVHAELRKRTGTPFTHCYQCASKKFTNLPSPRKPYVKPSDLASTKIAHGFAAAAGAQSKKIAYLEGQLRVKHLTAAIASDQTDPDDIAFVASAESLDGSVGRR